MGRKMINLLNFNKRKIPGSKSSGFTVVEILISLFVAAVVVSVAFELYIAQHNQLLVQEDVSEIQANARAAAELLAEEIRKTGYQLPAIITHMEAVNSDPDTLTIKYAKPMLAGAVLEQNMSDEYDNLDCFGTCLEGLEPGEWVYIYDETSDSGDAFIATEIDYEASVMAHQLAPLNRAYPVGSKLFAVERCKFYIAHSNRNQPNLMIQRLGAAPEVFAENIESLDFEYYLDDGTSTSVLANPSRVRMIGIHVVAKSFRPDLNSPHGEQRKRDFTLKVKLRNFGLS
jgi:type II secretory pathway pseudopilin PulG